MALSVFFSYYHKKQMERVFDWVNFEDQVKAYQKIYRLKLYFHLFSCLLLLLMYVVTIRQNFFYFSLVELVIILTMFPGQALFKRALRNEEVIVC
jgi:hypothetical protein